MRARYQSICVRFREDDPEHMAAYEYIHMGMSRNTAAADVIAELVKEKEKDRGGTIAPASGEQMLLMLSDVQRLCRDMDERMSRGAFPPDGDGKGDDDTGQEGNRSDVEMEEAIFDFALDIGD